MKKPLVLGLIILAVLLIPIIYFANKKINQTVGEKIMEKMVESQTGAKVDIDSGSNGQVTIKTDDGQAQYSAGGKAQIPDNFPHELLILSDAKIMLSSAAPDTSSVTLFTNQEATAVYDKYLQDLTAAGWEKGMQVDTGKGKMLSMTKGIETVVITIGENDSDDKDGKTTVHLAWTKETE